MTLDDFAFSSKFIICSRSSRDSVAECSGEDSELLMAMRPFFVSVVICTRNRAASLKRVLGSLANMSIPLGQRWQLVLVDNGSTDETPRIIEDFREKLPISRVFAPEAGLSNARNAGISAALGDYILWTDDDVEVEAGWLAAYTEAFERFPEAVVFGGRIIPVLETPSPGWFVSNLDLLCNLLAARDFGDNYLALSQSNHRIPYGANYAIRAAEQRQYVYDPALGAGPGRRRVGEETSVMKNILAGGHAGYWVPDSKVFHIISTSRQTRKYVVNYFSGHGETSALRTLSRHRKAGPLLTLRSGFHLFGNIAMYFFYCGLLQPRLALRRLMAIGHHLGALNYVFRHHQSPPSDRP